MPTTFQSSVLFVRDLAASRHFLENLLGQQVLMDHGPNVGFVGGFALWQMDHALETIFERNPTTLISQPVPSCELYFETDDLDVLWSQLMDNNVPVVHPLREQPWGQRVFRVYDPDRHIIDVGEPMAVVIKRLAHQGLTLDAIAGRTFMPPEIVQRIVEQTAM